MLESAEVSAPEDPSVVPSGFVVRHLFMCAFSRCPSLLWPWFGLGHFPRNLHPHLSPASVSSIPGVDGQLAVTTFFDTMLCKPTQGRSCWCVKNASDSQLPPAPRFPASQTCWPTVSSSWENKKKVHYRQGREKKRSGGIGLVFRTEDFRSILLALWADSECSKNKSAKMLVIYTALSKNCFLD